MATGLDVLGAAASALQIVGMICSLGNRILDKPKDTKALKTINDDSEKHIQNLIRWERDFTGDTKQACIDLRQQLQAITNEIRGQKGRSLFTRTTTCLKLYEPEFCKKFAKSLEEFKFRMCIENKRTADTMGEQLQGMTKAVEELRLTSNRLESLPGVGEVVAKMESEILKLSGNIQTMSNTIAEVESAVRKLEQKPLIPQMENLIVSDGHTTREHLRDATETVIQRLDKVQERLELSESVTRIRAETLAQRSDLVWHDEAVPNEKFKLWSLDNPLDEQVIDGPQATLHGLDLSSERLDSTYIAVAMNPHIAAHVDEEIREKKRLGISSISPFVALVKRGAYLEQLHEYVPKSILQRFEENVPPYTQAEVLRIVQTLAQEYRYSLLDRIVRDPGNTLPKRYLVEDMERAMLAVQAEKLEISLDMILPGTFDDVNFPFNVRVAITSAQVIEFGGNRRPILSSKDDHARFRMARQLVTESSLAGLHKLGRQGLSEILRSFFSLMKVREPYIFDRHFEGAMSGGVVKIIESAFHPTGSRTMPCQFDKFFKDKGKALPQGKARKYAGRGPFTEATFNYKNLNGPVEVLPVELVCNWLGGPVLHKCVLRSTTFQVEYEGVHLFPPAPTDPEGDGLPVTWEVGLTEQIPVWTEDLLLQVFRNDPIPVFSTRSKDGLRMGEI